jgi:Kef-type K+ transport system membrane component KefB
VLYRLKRIPTAITEVFLGIILGILLPAFFFTDDVIRVLGTLGVITIFVSGGMETDLDYIFKNKRHFIENFLVQLALIVIVSAGLVYILRVSLQIGLLVSLALLTPSAGFIFALLTHTDESKESKKLMQSTVVSLEMLSLLLLLIFLNLGNPLHIFLGILVVSSLIFLLPIVLKWLYENMFKKIIGMEFGFIFVVALISAYVTEWIGVHFIIGAFVAGIVSKQFLDKIKLNSNISRNKEHAITDGFSFFAQVFAPFYFFSIGLLFKLELFTLNAILYAVGAFIIILGLRFIANFWHHRIKGRQKQQSINLSIIILPTLLFTFVVATLLNTNFTLDKNVFGAILIYGILASTIPLFFLNRKTENSKVANI